MSEQGDGAHLVIGGSDPALDQRLSDELDAYNRTAAGAGEQREFTVKVEDGRGHLVAGLSGWTWGTAAGIGMAWVREDRRREGHGSRLLDAAERIALDRGCERIHVSSFTFQAPGFYARHGYVQVGRTEALPVAGQADVHFVKHLRGDLRQPLGTSHHEPAPVTEPATFQEQVDVLAHGEVHALLFATDVERRERLGVHVVLISPADDVVPGGHSSTTPVFSRWSTADDDAPVTDDEVRRMRAETIGAFAARLREVLAVEP